MAARSYWMQQKLVTEFYELAVNQQSRRSARKYIDLPIGAQSGSGRWAMLYSVH